MTVDAKGPCLDETQFYLLARGALSNDARLVAEAHLDRCESCQKMLAAALMRWSPVASAPFTATETKTATVAAPSRMSSTLLAPSPLPAGDGAVRVPLGRLAPAAPKSALAALNALTRIEINPLEAAGGIKALIPQDPAHIRATADELIPGITSSLPSGPALATTDPSAASVAAASQARGFAGNTAQYGAAPGASAPAAGPSQLAPAGGSQHVGASSMSGARGSHPAGGSSIAGAGVWHSEGRPSAQGAAVTADPPAGSSSLPGRLAGSVVPSADASGSSAVPSSAGLAGNTAQYGAAPSSASIPPRGFAGSAAPYGSSSGSSLGSAGLRPSGGSAPLSLGGGGAGLVPSYRLGASSSGMRSGERSGSSIESSAPGGLAPAEGSIPYPGNAPASGTTAAAAGETSAAEASASEPTPEAAPAPTSSGERAGAARAQASEEGWNASLPRGEVIGRYVVVDWLGEGAMSEVFVGYDTSLKRKVALKVVHPPMPLGREVSLDRSRERLLVEAQLLARLSHPNIVRVFDVGAHGDGVFLALELIDGVMLRQWCAQAPRGWRSIVTAFRAAAEGLVAAHAAGVIHRDFKPDNVLVESSTGTVRVADFGVARNVGTVAESPVVADGLLDRSGLGATATQRGAVIGTPAYMAPAQLAGAPADAASDQYSFCLSLAEMLTGSRPTQAGLATAAMPRWLKAVLHKGLAPEASQRYASMSLLSDELSKGLRRRARLWVGLGALGATAVAASVVAAFTLMPGKVTCSDGSHRLSGVWDAPQIQRLQAAFAAVGSENSADAWARTQSALESYASEWRTMRLQTCEATHVHGEQSDEAMDARMQCLDQRLGAMAALSKALEQVDAAALPRAPEAAGRLMPLATCVDGRALLSLKEPEPKNVEEREFREKFRGELDAVSAQVDLGRYERAIEHTASLAPGIATVKGTSLEARYYMLKGNAAYATGDFEGARAAVLSSAEAGMASTDFSTAARMFGKLAILSTHGTKTPSTELARGWFAQARVAAQRVAQPEERHAVAASLARDEGLMFAGLKELPDAESAFRRALELGAKSESLGPAFLSQVSASLGVVVQRQGRVDEGLALIRDAIAQNVKVEGEAHPSTAALYLQLGQAGLENARFADALEACRASIRIASANLPEESPVLAYARLHEADALVQLGRAGEAVPLLDKAMPIAKSAYGATHPSVAYALVVDGDARRAAGDVAHARRSLDEAYELLVQQKAGLGARMRWVLAQVLAKQGLARQARVLAKQAQAGFAVGQGLYGPNPELDAFLKGTKDTSARRGVRSDVRR